MKMIAAEDVTLKGKSNSTSTSGHTAIETYASGRAAIAICNSKCAPIPAASTAIIPKPTNNSRDDKEDWTNNCNTTKLLSGAQVSKQAGVNARRAEKKDKD